MTRIGNGFAFLKDGNIFMAVVALMLFLATVGAVVALLIAMFVKDKPLYGVLSLVVIGVPGFGFAFLYQALSAG